MLTSVCDRSHPCGESSCPRCGALLASPFVRDLVSRVDAQAPGDSQAAILARRLARACRRLAVLVEVADRDLQAARRDAAAYEDRIMWLVGAVERAEARAVAAEAAAAPGCEAGHARCCGASPACCRCGGARAE